MKHLLVSFFILVNLFSDDNYNETIVDENIFKIRIIRTSENDKSITGELYVNEKFICHTLELPWKDNTFFISSIPSKKYGGFIRLDKNGVSNVEFWRIQLTNTEPRTYIQIHKGEKPEDIKGCIIVGNKVFNNRNKLDETDEAFNELKKLFPRYTTSKPIKIEISIEYGKSQTIYKILKNKSEYFIYQGNGKWQGNLNDKTKPVSYKEFSRDLDFIYLKGEYKKDGLVLFYEWALPLKGNRIKSRLSSKYWSGEWENGEIVSREN